MTSRLEKFERAARAFFETLKQPDAGPDEFIQNKPPFIGPLLADLEAIDPETPKLVLLQEVIKQSHQYNTPYLKTIMMRRQGDPTGLMGLIIGKSQSPEQTVDILTEVGDSTLDYLNKRYNAERNTLLAMFYGEQADWKNMPIANDLLLFAIGQLKQNGITQSAEDFLRSNEKALQELFWDSDRKAQLNDRYHNMNPILLNARVPTIVYTEDAGVIKQQYILPAMPEQNASLLQEILPEETSIPILMRVINMGGHPLVRAGKEVIEELLKTQQKSLSEMNPQQVQYEVLMSLRRGRH